MRKWLLISFILLTGCSDQHTDDNAVMHVDAEKITSRNIPYTLNYSAIVQGVVDYAVVPRVSGVLYEQYYKEGSFVHKDQVLYKIDPRPFELALQQDEGRLIKDRAALHDNQKIYTRYKELYQYQSVALQDVEEAHRQYQASVGDVKTDEATIAQDKLNLQYCLVRSPTDGFIGERLVSVGATVVALKTKLNHINSSDNMYLLFSMPESQRLEIEEGVNDHVLIAAENNAFPLDVQLVNGKILSDVGHVDFTNTRLNANSDSWSMRAYVDNQSLKNKLLSGQYVTIYLRGIYYKNVFVVPQTAVLFDQKGAYVYVSQSNKAVRRYVTLGHMLNQGQWMIAQGLFEGDIVITNGNVRVEDNMPIIIDHIKE